MKSFLFLFVSFFFFYVNAQIEAPPDFEGELLYKFDTDSIPDSGIRLKEVVLFQPLRFKNMNQLRDYVILRNRTLRVYPYAKLASDRLDTLSVRLNSINGKKQKKTYLKRIEKFIYDEFEEELKKLSRSQGRILIKLVHRQTGETTHELVRELRNGWRAMIYQTTASLFKLSLKDTYDPEANYEDFLIEDILQRAYGDGLIELDPTALTYSLDTLYGLWKAPKTPLTIENEK
ncbi:MAG: DUF4294 domain-containing protein [Flavobacteriaceae bacterium]|nr:DUF4294 domain-containing protein [Flavobacteriaceae bacterium]MDG1884289.1 DUF4294 domain-containing protein [Flavobacteriaceae bacterium]